MPRPALPSGPGIGLTLPVLLTAAFAAATCSGVDEAGCTGPETSPCAQAFLDTLERRTFGFFWHETNPATGLTPDRWPTPSFSSIAAVGFGLTALPIGVERGFVGRPAAAERAHTTLSLLWSLPQGAGGTGVAGYQGFFYHFLDQTTGLRYATNELSTVDTALLLGGVLFCREYFDGADATETAIRALADSLYRRVNWQWAQPRPPTIALGWTPEDGFIAGDWRGYNEAMLIYILALGSPTYPVDPAAWDAWTATYEWGQFYGYEHVGFAPHFGHFFSHVWVDFRDIQDPWMRSRGLDYFENSRRATYAQQAYAKANPLGWRDYGTDVWGLTASDGPADLTLQYDGQARQFYTYAARGASFTEIRDDGTVAPTAVGGSVPFAPEITVPALLAMRQRYGDWLFSEYGFLDAFNPSFRFQNVSVHHGRVVAGVGWFDTDYLGIDQGPILAMVANHRADLVWRYMRQSPYVIQGLRRAGFQGGWLDQAP